VTTNESWFWHNTAGGAYQRAFANGWAVVNPGTTSVTLTFPAGARQVVPQGGGAVDGSGATSGSVSYAPATSLTLAPATAAIVLK
jgi:hypothetical protein